MSEKTKGLWLGLVIGTVIGTATTSFICMDNLAEAKQIREIAAEQQALLDKYADQNKEMMELIDELMAEKDGEAGDEPMAEKGGEV